MVVRLDPVIFSLGPLQVRWYGMMYVIGFIISGYLLRKLVDEGFFHVAKEKIDSYITHLIIGLFLGARLFYVFVYNWDYYSQNLTELLAVWRGGLSYHGAIIGLLCGSYIFARRNKIPFLQILDVTCVAGSQGVFWGRIGNFINGEFILTQPQSDRPFESDDTSNHDIEATSKERGPCSTNDGQSQQPAPCNNGCPCKLNAS